MVFRLKLRTGFFQTRPYTLDIRTGKMLLIPEGIRDETIIITDDDLLTVSIISKKDHSTELDISTENRLYIGILNNFSDVVRLGFTLATEFGRKFNLEGE